LHDIVHGGEYEDNVWRDDVETMRTSEIYIYIGVSVVLQTQLRSGLYNSFLTRTPGSERVRNSFPVMINLMLYNRSDGTDI